ncbi:hypothetical protein AN640_01555 [Candidatus Epulonipiscium fishelsonii]|uniref:Uncharacterized protein n=1 Tax=Candidatus Epulonipiscium fishelsonii TaxID=77094 RepID=A0ACC8XBM7_9FIRM|nr:hypothetical protein AN640_01555 [Epulopiscium sp. SCG-D08WGA-EpuloA1]OON92099.1 MAG: hypothetical protein ATN32_09965 [Epulopiscium sp. AS2M-Bin002]
MINFKFTVLAVITILIFLLIPPSMVDVLQTFVSSLLPISDNSDIGIEIPYLDKFVHMGMFFGLTFVYYIEYYVNYKILPAFPKLPIILILFALSTEIMQLLSGYRTFDLLDLLADAIGILLGTFLMTCLYKIRYKI